MPLLNEHLECVTVGDVNIYKHMLPQLQCSLIDSLLFCIFSLSFKWSAHHILSKTSLTLTVWQCKMCKIHMGCFTNLDWTSFHNYVWIVPDLLGTFGFYLISSLPSDFVCHKSQVNLINVAFVGRLANAWQNTVIKHQFTKNLLKHAIGCNNRPMHMHTHKYNHG